MENALKAHLAELNNQPGVRVARLGFILGLSQDEVIAKALSDKQNVFINECLSECVIILNPACKYVTNYTARRILICTRTAKANDLWNLCWGNEKEKSQLMEIMCDEYNAPQDDEHYTNADRIDDDIQALWAKLSHEQFKIYEKLSWEDLASRSKDLVEEGWKNYRCYRAIN
ncbi:MAG: hypothetical protein EOP04_09990 [Proteobacteria bacterium]|nr:MAG: hypothetical protein EOP04_09990 [Pseudomonadota bacterium]